MNYHATVTREGDTWLADVPSVPGAHTFARSLPGLLKSLKEVIVLMDDLPDDGEVALELAFVDEDALIDAASETRNERAQLACREAELAVRTRVLAAKLTGEKYSVRDSAVLLGLTPGRISQLMNS